MSKLPDLPASEDKEFWVEAETQRHQPAPIGLCAKDQHRYQATNDGLATCELCPWGIRLGGTLRVVQGKIVDLRDQASE